MNAKPHRRAVLLGAVGLSLVGCSHPDPPVHSDPNSPQRPPRVPPTNPESEPTTRPASPAATSAPTAPPLPSREDILHAYSGKTPAQWGLDVPGVMSGLPSAHGAALTLDYCGGPGGSGTDRSILDVLREHGQPATLFLNARWIDANPTIARELADDPLFELANHGSNHVPLTVAGLSAYGLPGTSGPAQVYDEIMVNARMLAELTGTWPRFFRSGTAHIDDVAASVCLDLGMIPVGFTINGDGGATFPASLVSQEVGRARAGDIIIAHGNQPTSGTGAGLPEALAQLKDAGVNLLKLSDAAPS